MLFQYIGAVRSKVIGDKHFLIKLMILFIAIFSISIVEIHAQASKENIIEPKIELSEEDQDKKSLLRLIIYGQDAAEKRLAIQVIHKQVVSGKIKSDDSIIISALTFLGRQGTTHQMFDKNGKLMNNSFFVRRDACNVLGNFRGAEAEAGLISIMRGDVEPIIVSVAMENLLKSNPSGTPFIIRDLVRVFKKFHNKNPDNILTNTFLRVSAEFMANSEGRLITQDLLQAIHFIGDPSNVYITGVKTRARTLLLRWLAREFPRYTEVLNLKSKSEDKVE